MIHPSKVLAPTRFSRYIYVALGITALLVVHIGFGRTYIAPVLTGAFTGRKILHLHGMIFMAWIVLTIIQPLLVQQGRILLHRKLGVYGAVLGGLVVLMGLYIGISSANVNATRDGQQVARAFLLTPITDMMLFATFLTLAIRNTRNPEAHKRYIMLCTLSILPAAFGRIFPLFTWWTGNLATDTLLALLVMELTLYIGVLYDVIVMKKIHPVYVWGGLLVLIVHGFRDWASGSDIWMNISNWIVEGTRWG